INDTLTKLLSSQQEESNRQSIRKSENVTINDKILKIPRGTRDYHP
ncbi:unnamed protein product, partial [Rotaria magnacalcarata]